MTSLGKVAYVEFQICADEFADGELGLIARTTPYEELPEKYRDAWERIADRVARESLMRELRKLVGWK